LVTILRIGHRIKRDKRITTHLALVARAFGASRIIIAGEKDPNLERSMKKVVSEWGGNFQVEFIPKDEWKNTIEQWKERNRKIIHLTMYGENLIEFEQNTLFESLRRPQNLNNLLIVVGSKKVPGKIFSYADWNIAIGNQPHSEVSSLAVFLDHFMPQALKISFDNAEKQIIPSVNGKKMYMGEKNNGK
jgi:tRNA (cytidine56-2'-O)-methyltransferase